MALGAHVTIVARRQDALDQVVDEMKKSRISTKQRCDRVMADVSVKAEAHRAFVQASELIGTPVDYVFCCAGASIPGLFVEQSSTMDCESGMQLNYFGTLYTLQAAAQDMQSGGRKGKLVIISSFLGLVGLAGYTQYAPTKYALRGLAECLRQELLPHSIDVHIYYVATILSPGYEKEQLSKPDITKYLEGAEQLGPHATPDARAKTLLSCLAQRNHFAITSDWLTDFFRLANLGAVPRNSFFVDYFLACIINLIFPLIRKFADTSVLQFYRNKK